MEAPDCVMMTHNENIKSWIHMSKADPLRLMVIMARRTATNDLSAPQTPAPEGWSHIDSEVFETTTEPIDVSSGSDAEPSTRKWRRPRADKTWQLRLQKLRTCRDRSVQYINELEQKYLERFRDGIVEGDPLFDKDRIWTAEERANLRRDSEGTAEPT